MFRFNVMRHMLAWATFLAVGTLITHASSAQDKITFDDHIKPLFRQRCAACHNPDKKNGDLDVTNYTNLMQGGGSGEVVAAGDVSGSYLFSLVNHDDEPAMPPDSPRIPDAEIELLRNWIEQGALENKSSKAKMSAKPKVAALDESPLERPSVVVVPARIPLEPANTTELPNAITAMHSSPWAPVIAIGGPGQVHLYSVQDRQLAGILEFPEGTLNVLRFSRNGSLLMGAGGRPGAQGIVAIWDVASGQRLATLDEEVDAILAADISPDQQRVVVGGPQKMVRVYLTGTGELAYEIKKHTEWITANAFSPDGVLFASADRNGGIHIWETFTGREYLKLAGHGAAVTGLSWRSDSNLLASASEDGSIKLWEMENGGQVQSWNAHGGGVLAVEFTRDGRIASTGRDRVAKVWDQAGQQQVAMGGLGDIGTAVTHCDETNQVVVGDWVGNAIVFGADGNEVGRLEVQPPSLEERAQQAKQLVLSVEAKLTPEMTKKKEMDQQLASLQQQLDETVKGQTEKQQQYQTEVVTLEKEKKEFEVVNASQVTLVQEVAVLKKTLPSLEQALAKLTEAGAASGDKELLEMEQNARKALQTRQQLMEGKEKAAVVGQARLESLTKAIADRTAVAEQLKAEIATLAATQPELEQKTTAMNEQVAKQNEVVTAIQAEHGAAVQTQGRWESELQFVAQLRENRQRYRETEQAWFDKQDQLSAAEESANLTKSHVDEKTQALAGVQAQIDAQRVALEELTKAGTVLTEQITMLDTDRKTLEATQDKMSKGLTALAESIKNAAAALELAGEDEALTAVVKQLSDLHAAKKTELDGIVQAIAANEQNRVEASKLAEANNTEVLAGTERMAELDASATMLSAELEAAKTEFATLEGQRQTVESEAAALEQQLKDLEQQRIKLQGISA